MNIARDPFTPRITVGGGLAYSNSFPTSIEGAAPSIVQARASQFIFNRQQSYVVAQATKEARGAAIATSEKLAEARRRNQPLTVVQTFWPRSYYDGMARTSPLIRTQVQFTKEQLAGLRRLSAATGFQLPRSCGTALSCI